MDSNTAIGQVTQFVIQSLTTLGTAEDIPLNKNFVANREATYSQVKAAALALIALSKNEYYDVICITNISVNEVLAG